MHEEVSLGNIRTWKVTSENSDPEKILLYFHGGAYVVGNPEAYFPMMSYPLMYLFENSNTFINYIFLVLFLSSSLLGFRALFRNEE